VIAMRTRWAAEAALVVCLTLAAMPAAAQSPSPPPPPTGFAQVHSIPGGSACSPVTEDWPIKLECTELTNDARVNGSAIRILELGPQAPTDTFDGLFWWDVTIHGPDGDWTGPGYGVRDADGTVHGVEMLTGHGAYEGLVYAAQVTTPMGFNASTSGFIAEGQLPADLVTTSPPASPTPVPSYATIGQPADDGARVVAVEEIDARTRDLTIDSPAVGMVKVRLLLPEGFEAQPDTRWPVLYLLQGCCDTYDSWTRDTDVAALTAPLDLLVVMPAATRSGDGGFGWYTDWYNEGAGGQPAWETFHLTELRQLLERDWQAGDDRVIAGLSMGGLGTMTYAARHPDMFRAAASFSGVLGTMDPTFEADPRVWGSKTEDADIWAAHDPLSLAPALRGLPLYVSYGNGEAGPLDAADAAPDDREAFLFGLNEAFVARLAELGIPATVDAYGPGTHTWPYWQRALHEAMPMLLAALGMEDPTTSS
jgi:diacylglycerol O-acyltransferase / trehalose O-mycolyltransferase